MTKSKIRSKTGKIIMKKKKTLMTLIYVVLLLVYFMRWEKNVLLSFFNWRNAPFPLCVAQLCGYVTNIYHLHVKYAKSQKIPSEISIRYQNKYPLFDFFFI